MELDGRTAIVTGSTGRIGSAIAVALAGAGCDCLLHWHSSEGAAAELAGRIRAMGRKAETARADMGDEGQVATMFEQLRGHVAAGRLPRAGALVNSAAMFGRGPLAELDAEAVQRMLAVNLVGPLVACREFAGMIGDNETGKIINIVDVGGQRPWAGYAGYCSSKAGLAAATKTLAKELAPRINVNGIAPGVVTWPEADEQARQRQLRMIPLGRFGTAEEIASAALFLLGNDYVTGQIVNVDGGRSI